MIRKVVFFNFYHNGDIHISRGLVGAIAKICAERNIACEYYHKNHPSILADIPLVRHVKHPYNLHAAHPSSVIGETMFFNTWYCANMTYFDQYRLTFDCLYFSFRDAAKLLDIDLETIPGIDLFPHIDFNCFEIEKAKQWLAERQRPRVFISNGSVLSGQAENVAWTSTISSLAQNHAHIDFLVSNNDYGIVHPGNVFFTNHIIAKGDFDLNENAYLASNCQLIVGRCSSPYSFALIRENYWDNPKKFLAFTNLSHNEVIWTLQCTPPPSATFISHNVHDHRVTDLIKEHLP